MPPSSFGVRLALNSMRPPIGTNDGDQGWGPRFVMAVQGVLDRIVNQPDFYPLVEGDVREARVRRFPYSGYYRRDASQILVLAVFHTSRDPSGWLRRV